MSEKLTKEEERQFIHIKSKFLPIERIGEGTFSTVFKAKDLRNGCHNSKFVAIKNITRTTNPTRIEQELKFLLELNGENNVIELLWCERFEDQVIAVFPYFEFIDFRDLLNICTIVDIKYYMYNLLSALESVHKKNIIHRDLKPSNFLYNYHTRTGILIDFGLAEYEICDNKENIHQTEKTKKHSLVFLRNNLIRNIQPPGYYVGDQRLSMKAPRAGTRGFRAPEVLFKVIHQNTKIDMWGCGVIFLILLTKRYPFFNSQDDIDSLVEIATIFGSSEMKKAANYYGRKFKSNLTSIPIERLSFEEIVTSLNPEFNFGFEAFDLLYMLMDLYNEKRITAECALKHPFFNDIQ